MPYRRGIGDLQPLMESIDQRNCVLFPAVFKLPDGTYTVLAGERRAVALIRCGYREVPAHEIRSWAEFEKWLNRDVQAASQTRMPGMRFGPIEAGNLANQVRGLLSPKKTDWPDQVLATYTAVPLEALRDGRYLTGKYATHESPEVRAAAVDAIEAVNRGELTSSTAVKRVGKVERELTTGRRPSGPLVQRKVIGNAVSAASGIATALESVGPLNEHLTTAEREEWAKGLRRSRLSLDRFIKDLEGRTG